MTVQVLQSSPQILPSGVKKPELDKPSQQQTPFAPSPSQDTVALNTKQGSVPSPVSLESEIKGLTGDFKIAKAKPGVTVEQLQAAGQKNNLKELIIENETGLYVIYGANLEVDFGRLKGDNPYSDGEREKLSPGSQADFGKIKGIVKSSNWYDNPKNNLIDEQHRMTQKGNEAGSLLGGGIGLTVAAGIMFAATRHGVLAARIPETMFAFGVVTVGAVVLGALSGEIGGAIGNALAKVSVEPNSSKLDALLLPSHQVPELNDPSVMMTSPDEIIAKKLE